VNRPLAYLITWTTRGTRLHGDERGSWKSIAGTGRSEFIREDAAFLARQQELARHDPLVLDHAARVVVDDAIRRVAEVRGWTMITSNIRTNHVHAVVGASAHTPEEILRQFKAWSTRALRESGWIEGDRPVWTRHGSTRYLWDQESIASAGAYVRDGQDGHRWDQNPNPSRGA
tara:strand:+ start:2400 stop:2918 length:519 start_codon:yes stop_codon:yes gene_type:complete